MKTKRIVLAKFKFLIAISMVCFFTNKIQAQLSCTDKGYFFFKAYDSYHRIFYISNIIKGDPYWCIDGKKRYADDKKVEIFRIARRNADSKGNPPSDDIVPNNSGRNPRNGEILSNDYESVKKEYNFQIGRTKSPDKIVNVIINEKDFQ